MQMNLDTMIEHVLTHAAFVRVLSQNGFPCGASPGDFLHVFVLIAFDERSTTAAFVK
jgi:hypothetical protein